MLRLQADAGNGAIAAFLGAAPTPIQREIGWRSDASTEGKAWNLGERRVGRIRRLPLEGLKQGLQQESALRWSKAKKAFERESTMLEALSAESAKGKAIVLVPESLDPLRPIEVLLHLHGYTESASRPFAGWRALSSKAQKTALRLGLDREDTAPVRDVALDQAEQQLEESGSKQTVIVLPQGGLHSQFGRKGDYTFDSSAYVSEIVSRLHSEGVWKTPPAIGRINMSGHSGAGATLAKMARASVRAKAGKPTGETSTLGGDLVLFDAINGPSELSAFRDWALMRLNEDLAVLKDPERSGADKVAYLRGAQKLRGYASRTGRYGKTYVELNKAIGRWFEQHAAEIAPYAQALRANFSIVHVPVSHEELLRGVSAGKARSAGAGSILDALRALHPAAVKPTAQVPPAAKPVAPPKQPSPVRSEPGAAPPGRVRSGGKGAAPGKPASAAQSTAHPAEAEEWAELSSRVQSAFRGGFAKYVAVRPLYAKRLGGTSPVSWLNQLDFAFSFCGNKLAGLDGRLTARLTGIEKDALPIVETVRKAGAPVQFAGAFQPRATTDKPESLSDHALGLALHLNYANNPYIGRKGKRGSQAAAIIEKIATSAGHPGFWKEVGPRKKQSAHERIVTGYQAYADVSDAVATYFREMDRLQGDELAARTKEYDLVKRANAGRDPRNGFFAHTSRTAEDPMLRLVLLLAEGAGLQWGGIYASRPKDLHHFALKV